VCSHVAQYRHGVILNNCLQLIFFLLSVNRQLYNVAGLFIKITGKIGVRGISRTRVILFRFGQTRLACQTFRIGYNFATIITSGSVLGVKIMFYY